MNILPKRIGKKKFTCPGCKIVFKVRKRRESHFDVRVEERVIHANRVCISRYFLTTFSIRCPNKARDGKKFKCYELIEIYTRESKVTYRHFDSLGQEWFKGKVLC